MKTPRRHQKTALKAIEQGFKKHKRGKVIMATGTGKTLVALWACNKFDSILVLVPSLALARQVYKDWTDPNVEGHLGKRRWLAVCSDPTVTRVEADDGDISIEELKSTVGNVTNDPERITAFLKEKPSSVVISTYQSVGKLSLGLPKGFSFDVAVFDEAHKTAGRANKPFAAALNDADVRIQRRLFFTATPRRSTYTAYKGDPRVFHMDDPKVYGPTFHELSFFSAVKQKLICDYEVIVAVMQHREITRAAILAGDGNEALFAKVLQVLKTANKYKAQKIFAFFGTNKEAAIAQGLFEANDKSFLSLRVSGGESSEIRDNTLERFTKAGKAVVSNARCLGEGVNVPVCDAVAFLSARRSVVDVVQAVGRACRLKPGTGYTRKAQVILPIFINAGELMEEAKAHSAFSDAFDTLNALRENDEVLKDELRATRERLKNPEAAKSRWLDLKKIKFVVDSTQSIAGLSPDEFKKAFIVESVRGMHDVVYKKKTLLDLAKGAGPRPSKTTTLGMALTSYTSPKSLLFDSTLAREIWTLAPEWLPKTGATWKRQEMLEAARRGEPKPKSDTKQWLKFNRLLKDLRFRAEISKTSWAPQKHVVESAAELKAKFRAMKTAPKYETSDYWSLRSLVTPSGVRFDPKFRKEMLKRGLIFERGAGPGRLKALEKMRTNGRKRGEWLLRQLLSWKNRPSGRAFERIRERMKNHPEFRAEVLAARPEWFPKTKG